MARVFVCEGEVEMEPASSAELMLRVYDLFLLCLAVLLAAFTGLSLLT